MSVAGSQQQTFLRLLQELQPHWRRDQALPARIQTELGRHREFGARDRRLYRELIYTTLRYLAWVEPLVATEPERAVKIVAWLAADTRDTHAFRAAAIGDWPTLTSLAERAAFLKADAAALLPDWFRNECPAVFEGVELEAQLARAPLWIRLQAASPATVAAEFSANGWTWRESLVLPTAWQMSGDGDLTKTEAYATGAIEIQDLGSQFVLESTGVKAGGRWLDACAGAGGKTLQLARLVGATGTIDAFDIRPEALTELEARMQRAAAQPHAAPIRILRVAPPVPKSAEGVYDGVLVDAPCSGSGTWRRAPHLKWTTSPKVVANRSALQQTLLDRYASYVRPGGQLIYATCSLARRENEGVIDAFLSEHRDFEIQPPANTFGFPAGPRGLTILPAKHDTDGFFVAALRRR
jgi:16S rRNA (cytosine967-C5)-methyltransferase